MFWAASSALALLLTSCRTKPCCFSYLQSLRSSTCLLIFHTVLKTSNNSRKKSLSLKMIGLLSSALLIELPFPGSCCHICRWQLSENKTLLLNPTCLHSISYFAYYIVTPTVSFVRSLIFNSSVTSFKPHVWESFPDSIYIRTP